MPEWSKMSPLEQSAVLYSDLHRDVFGFRPGPSGGIYHPETLEEYESAMEKLQVKLTANEEHDRRRELSSQFLLEMELAGIMEVGAFDWNGALRWWFQSHGFEKAAEESGGKAYDHQNAEQIMWSTGVAMCVWPMYVDALLSSE